MHYLVLAILCSSLIAIIFKVSEKNNFNRYAVTCSNYFIAFLISLVISFNKGLFNNIDSSFISMINEFREVIFGGEIFTQKAVFAWSSTLGIISGVFFFLSFLYYQKSVKSNGAGLSGTFSKLGILVPMVFSIIAWGEIPSLLQWIGISLSLIAIVAVNLSSKDINAKSINSTLILLFIFGGLAEFSNKIFQKYAGSEYKDLFLFFVFLCAFIISFIFIFKKNRSVNIKDIITGFLVGIPNLFSSFFLILSLNYLNTSVAFTMYSTGSILLINLVSCIFFKEKLSKKDLLCTGIILFSIILINI